MKAYLIDTPARDIRSIDLPDPSTAQIRAMQQAIGCSLMDSARFNSAGDQVWVDDTGMLDGKERFSIEGYGAPLAGRGVVIGMDWMGEATEPSISLDDLRHLVSWSAA